MPINVQKIMMNNRQPIAVNPIGSNHGFSLIEVLVSLFVISIGMLGIVGLFTSSIRFTDSAYLNSQAIVLSYDLIEKIRANPQAITIYQIDHLSDVTASPDCNTASCTATTMAQADLANWKLLLTTELPAADASVAVTSSKVTITISWTDRGEQQSHSIDMTL